MTEHMADPSTNLPNDMHLEAYKAVWLTTFLMLNLFCGVVDMETPSARGLVGRRFGHEHQRKCPSR